MTEQRTSVVLVTADAALRAAASGMVRRLGYHILELESAAEALAELGDPVELVLVDLDLPDDGALQIVQATRRSAHAGTPVVVLCKAAPDEETRLRAVLEGVDEFLIDPIAEGRLESMVMSLVRARGLRATAEEARYLSAENRYRVLFELSPVPTWVTDGATTAFLAVNEAAVRQYGYSRAEFLGMRRADLSGPPGGPDTAHRLADGTLIEVEIASHPVEFDGRAGELVIARNVTTERAAERALRDSEDRFRALTEKAGELVTIIDRTTRIRYASPSHAALLGRDPDALLGELWIDLVHVDDAEGCRGVIEGALADVGAEVSHRVRMVDAAGRTRVFEATARNMMDHGAIAGIVCNARDVTEREAAAAELRFQAQLLDTVEQAVVATDADGRITYWNRFAERLYGWSASEARGHSVVAMMQRDLPPSIGPSLTGCLPDDRSWRGEIVARGKREREFLAQATCSPILDVEGRPIGTVIVTVDITELKSLEEQLRQAQKLEAVGQLAGGIAHDFNNLLTVIGAHAGFLLGGVGGGGDVAEDARAILAASDRASALTRQLLAFSRKQMLMMTKLPLNDIVEGTVRFLERLLPEDVELRRILAPDVGEVMVDVGQIEQVLMNLVVNARDAMPTGGRLTVRTAMVTAGEAGLDGGPDSGFALLSVEDTGVGMTEEVLAHAFEPFFTTKAVGKGTGLGLATVYGVVKQCGGEIRVRTRLGEGTTFDIYLPSASEQPRAVPAPESRGDAAMAPRVVLLVEPDRAVREIAARSLRREQCEVIEAGDAQTALAAVEARGDDLAMVIADAGLAGAAGLDVVRRARVKQPAVAVILMTSSLSREHTRFTGDDGGAIYVEKPFTPRELAKQVRECLSARRSSNVVG